ncbi:uncharacterized protein SPAPADRAFT_61584 [Spathaspora passalidarum NRRL Y-27907]|uniref:Uncharacterized protein ATP19 n=1 Tax=Spathaspora passalidarum (strain NRRL Y-27907 / 11-Y1) TaxID=619300 RepID=G3ANJ3_SPAPN|nr:uncharacterized protein SPAPADRAFT_61584 [Spathaspora passalidarum NRRL Y-27907]EGW32522.1 hypothetical protein SPAPADRAFT_61584 [Spathaspora passalidarum NRRL Y-27907]
MGAAYTILGRTFQPHQLAIATLGAVVYLVAPKPWAAKEVSAGPAINASSPEEEKFVKEWLAKHTAEEKH